MKPILVTALALTSSAGFAAVSIQDLGTGAPPAMLGSFQITMFLADSRPEFDVVQDVLSPLGGEVKFSAGMDHLLVGTGWGSWSHGFDGDVYATLDTSVTLELPENTCAFLFYAEPDTDVGLIRATADDGSFLELTVGYDAAANGYGFYTDGTTVLTSIEIQSFAGFAIGEFGIASCVVPEATTMLSGAVLAGLTAAGFWARRRGCRV